MTTPFFRSAFAVLAFVGISVLTARAPLHAQVDLGLGGPPGVGGSDGSPKVTWSFSVEPKAAAPGDEVDVVATYKVETGWHIYAPDFVGTGKPTELKIEGSSVETSGTLRFPKPTIKRDDLLEETHRILKKGGDLRQKVRLAKDASGEVTIGLSVSYMSCDANNCLPPSTKKGQVVVQIGAAVAKANGADSVAAKPTEAAPTEEKPKTLPLPKPVPLPGIGLPGGGLPGGGVDIGPHAKWKLRIEPANARPGGKVEIIAEYEVSDGYYIYSPDQPPKESYPTRFELGSDQATLTNLQTFPKPKIKKIVDTEYRTLAGKGVIRKQIEIGKSVPGGALELPVTVHYMTCFDGGCDPPAKEQATVTVNIVGAKAAPPGAAKPDSAKPIEGAKPDSASVGSDSNTTDTSTDATSSSEEAAAPTGTAISSASSLISGSSLFQFILLMIGGGLFALVMPCTYPMIPITISVFTKIAESRKGAVLPVAIVYGLGIVGSFNLVGLAIYFAIGGVASTSILDLASSPSLNLVIGIVFFIFALSFFGIITLRLPGSVSNIGVKFSGTSSLVGVLALGATLVVTSFTCTAPIMGPLLIYAGQDGDLARVMLGMTVFGLTMAVPFFWLSLFPGWVSSMPRAGGWMNTVKIFLGFLELAAALKFLSSAERVWGEGGAPLGLLPREALLMLWAVIFGVAGLYLLRAFRFKDDGDEGIGPGRLFVSLLIMSLALWFHMGSRGMRLDWITESQMPPYNVEYVVGGIATSPAEDHGVEVDNVAEGMEKAKELGRLALVDFTGPLCSNCIAMEKSVFPKFKHLLDQFVMIKLNTDENPRQEENRAYQLQLVKSLARPIYAVVDPANPNVPIEVFGRADLPSGKDFGAFLKRHVSE